MFRALIESLPDALLVTNSDGSIYHVNSLFELMFGYHRNEITGQPVEILIPERFRKAHHKERNNYFIAPRVRPMGEGTGLYGLHKKGYEFPIEIHLSPLQEDDNLWGLAAIRDISVRKKMEDELRCARDELELRVTERTHELLQTNESLRFEIAERNRMTERVHQLNAELAHVARLSILGEMTSGLTHELNQPLAAISNYSQGCIRRLQSNNVDLRRLIPALEHITAEALRASEIMARYRQFARKEKLQKHRISIVTLIKKAVELEQFEASTHGLLLQILLQNNLPNVLVDEIQIQQVMVNLLRNAIEAIDINDDSSRTIFINVSSKNDTVTVAVEDHGHGITEVKTEQLFQAFYTTKPEGLGMGLSISRSIIEAHNGHLWAEANQLGGTTFFFTLSAVEE